MDTLNVLMLNVLILNVLMLNVLMLNVSCVVCNQGGFKIPWGNDVLLRFW
jgi:hypothetical protein